MNFVFGADMENPALDRAAAKKKGTELRTSTIENKNATQRTKTSLHPSRILHPSPTDDGSLWGPEKKRTKSNG